MFFVPKVMSTQHPDNATPSPFADESGVIRGDGEVQEAADIFCPGLQRTDVGLGGQRRRQPGGAEAAYGLPRLLPEPAQAGQGCCPDPAGAQSRHREGHAQVHGGSAPERAIGLGHGPQLLRGWRRRDRPYPGSHPALYDLGRRTCPGGSLLPARHCWPGGPYAAGRTAGEGLGRRILPQAAAGYSPYRGHGAPLLLRPHRGGVPAGGETCRPSGFSWPAATRP